MSRSIQDMNPSDIIDDFLADRVHNTPRAFLVLTANLIWGLISSSAYTTAIRH